MPDLNSEAVERAAESIGDLLVHLGVDPDDAPEHAPSETVKWILARTVLDASGLAAENERLEDRALVAEADARNVRAEVERLRARTHEIAAAKDRKMSDLQSRVEQTDRAFAEARERVKDVKADWTTDPPSQEEGGFWRYTSYNTKMALGVMAKEVELLQEALGAAFEFLEMQVTEYEGHEDAYHEVMSLIDAAFSSSPDPEEQG